MSGQYFIEEFIEKSNSCKTQEELFGLYREAVEQFGYTRIMYSFITEHPFLNKEARHGEMSNYPEDWMKHYFENGYIELDPVIMWGRNSRNIFSWDIVANSSLISKKQELILNKSEEAGLKDGLGIPLHGLNGEFAGVGLARAQHCEELSKNILDKIRIITEQFHLVYCNLSSEDKEPAIPKLTQREIEMLKWWALGKTTEEISSILNCSESNVKYHIKSIYRKLEANTKIIAVTKAIRLGLINLDLMKR